jgi:hypothetical protein
MNGPLQLAILISVLIALFKGAELLLRPHQQKKLKEALETATLFLSYNQPLHVFAALSPSRLADIVAPLALLSAAAALPNTIAALTVLREGYWVAIIVALFLGYCAFKTARGTTAALMIWIGFSDERTKSIGRLARNTAILSARSAAAVGILAACFPLYAMLAYYVLHLLFEKTPAVNEDLLRLASLAALPWLLFAVTVVLTAAFVAIACGWLIVFEVAIRLCTALGWRIVEFEKGPVAALAALATLVLSVLQLLLFRQGTR